jgi:MoaA/NifB/PqqE/SkfB family radical SAM enzyme
VSLSTVILKETLPYLQYVVQIADILGVIKVKMVVPVLRGRAKNLKPSDFACNEDIAAKFAEIVALKNQLGWKPRIKFTFWDKSTEGYALLVYPDKKVYAWPVLGAPDSVLLVGDLANDSIQDVWSRYPYRKNHVDKYVGLTMHRS